MKLFTVPSIVVIIVAALLCFFAWCGVQTSIADAIYILGLSFCFTHVFGFIYYLGKTHGRNKCLVFSDTKEPVINKPHIRLDKTSNSVSDVGEKSRKKKWNPVEDFV